MPRRPSHTHLRRLAARALGVLALAALADAKEVADVELQSLAASAARVVEALELLGAPLPAVERAAPEAASGAEEPRRGAQAIQEVLDRHCLAFVHSNPESRVKVAEGPAPERLAQNGWRSFLVKAHNEGAVTAPLEVTSPSAKPLGTFATKDSDPPQSVGVAELRERSLEVAMFDQQPLRKGLSGFPVEYRIVHLSSRDAGLREATLDFSVGQGTQDLGFRSELPLLFECAPSVELELGVLDEDGELTTAAFVVRDTQGRLCPAQMRRARS